MTISTELLDAYKAALGGISDYAAARKIGVTQQMISRIRNNDSNFSPEKVIFLTENANLDSIEWLLKYHRERAKCDKENAIFDTLLSRMVA